MEQRGRSKIIAAAMAALVVVVTGCRAGESRSSAAGNPGVTGTSYQVTVGRQPGGTVTSTDGQINCGTAPGASQCGPATYAWDATATLIATPDEGNMFGTWAGDCVGRGVCTLGTSRDGADKYVVAVFDRAGLTQHENFSLPSVHGPEGVRWFRGCSPIATGPCDTANTFRCNVCHASTYNGLATAPSCNACHASAGFPRAADCNTCHDSPPPSPHPAVLGGLTECITCHDTTVDASGNILAGGTHMNGRLDGGGHEPGFGDPAVHGPAFFASTPGIGGSTCSGCHGENYEATIVDGGSCNTCHANAGFPGWQTNCTFCHGAPPPPAPASYDAGTHPTVSSDITTCTTCHSTTMNSSGDIVASGTHLDGVIQGGHDDFTAPSLHGREFFRWISNSPDALVCTTCHGSSFGATIADGESCNTCHASAGWTSWQTNCSFCHGVRDITTRAGYDVAENPTFSAPPDAISQRLDGIAAPDRTGAHTGHLTSPWAKVQCGACHVVPTALTHISGTEVRAAVVLAAPGTYNADTSCSTACHGSSQSPVWASAADLQCDGCHAVPPDTSAHLGLSATDLGAECSGCHPDTISDDGTFNLVAGAHVNGSVQRPPGHAAGFFMPSAHGSAYLDTLAGAPAALDCASCHADHTNCDTCHGNPAAVKPELAAYTTEWANWDENCTFCHGTKSPVYTSADVTSGDPGLAGTRALAAPPDAVSQRLTGTAAPERTGLHVQHITGSGSVAVYATPMRCASCHAVPMDVNHVSEERRADVVMSFESAFPSSGKTGSLGTYDSVDGSCVVYCHGSTMVGGTGGYMGAPDPTGLGLPPPWWYWYEGAPNLTGCNDCHGQPPKTGSVVTSANIIANRYCNPLPTGTTITNCDNHTLHRIAMSKNGYDGCSNCHFGSGSNNNSGNLHVNGVSDVVFGYPPGRAFTFPPYTSATKTCGATDCHFQTGGTEPTKTW